MCQLVELHPRSGCFPNDMVDRVGRFYRDWGQTGVHGVVLHGGWLPGERFGDYAAMEDNIGFGINLDLHWKLLWNPFRDDVDRLKSRWLARTYGAGAREVVGRCLDRAGRIYRLGPEVAVADDPTYRDYQGYAAKADGVAGDAGFLYPFGFDMLLLNDKLTTSSWPTPRSCTASSSTTTRSIRGFSATSPTRWLGSTATSPSWRHSCAQALRRSTANA